MIALAAETSAEDAAWITFDIAMLDLHRMYTHPGMYSGQQRRAQASDAALAWVRFRDLFGTAAPGSAA